MLFSGIVLQKQHGNVSRVGRREIRTTSSLFQSPAASYNVEADPAMVKVRFQKGLQDERQRALLGGGLDRIEKLHARGSLTARERLELLFDHGSFHELDSLKAHRCMEFGMDQKKFPGDGIVTVSTAKAYDEVDEIIDRGNEAHIMFLHPISST
jgi:hypothetical protein